MFLYASLSLSLQSLFVDCVRTMSGSCQNRVRAQYSIPEASRYLEQPWGMATIREKSGHLIRVVI